MRDISNNEQDAKLNRRRVLRDATTWFCLGLLGCSCAIAQSGGRRGGSANRGLSADEAAAKAQAQYGGRVLAVRRARNGYNVRIRHQDGRVAEYFISAGGK